MYIFDILYFFTTKSVLGGVLIFPPYTWWAKFGKVLEVKNPVIIEGKKSNFCFCEKGMHTENPFDGKK